MSGSRGPKKTRRGTAADARARLRKAREFLDAVDALERAEASADVIARNAILAAIAAADTFCWARDGNYSLTACSPPHSKRCKGLPPDVELSLVHGPPLNRVAKLRGLGWVHLRLVGDIPFYYIAETICWEFTFVTSLL